MKKLIKKGLLFGFYCIIVLWIIMGVVWIFPELTQYGIIPRELSIKSFLGILTSPFIHKDFIHIVSNSIPLFLLITTLVILYRRVAFRVILFSILMGGSLVWVFGREASHIGSSGLILSLIGFLIANVFFRKDWKSLLIAICVVAVYGGAIFGIFPNNPTVSWESHLFGFLSGIYLAFAFRKTPEIARRKL